MSVNVCSRLSCIGGILYRRRGFLYGACYRRQVKRSLFNMKVESGVMESLMTEQLRSLVKMFEKHGYEVRMAGGAVRDVLSGLTPADVDLATDATPPQMKLMFEQEEVRTINAKGEKHGTVTARIEPHNFEVTTLRVDVVTDGRHAEVEFTTDWELDAGRRDFTVNSMFLSPDGTLHDYCNGYRHLQERRVVFVGDADRRIKEDYLRILRYFRFYGKISPDSDRHDPDILKTIADNASSLTAISGERIWSELKKILTGNFCDSLISKMLECGIAKYIGLPDKVDTARLKILLERSKGMDLSPVTIVSSLFDNEEQFDAFRSRCKLSNREKNIGSFIIMYRDDNRPLKFFQNMLLSGNAVPITREQIEELLKYKGDLVELEMFEKWEAPRLPLNGTDLLSVGVPPGRSLGHVMQAVRQHWIQHDCQPTKDQLLGIVPDIATRLNVSLVQPPST